MSNYLLVSAMAGGCSVVFILQAIKTAKDRRDSNRIYQFLCRSLKDGRYRFRSSEAISAVTNLHVSRVAELCSKHGDIERKEQHRHMWRVGGSANRPIQAQERLSTFLRVEPAGRKKQRRKKY